MAENIEFSKQRLLLVEGKEDVKFLEALLKHLEEEKMLTASDFQVIGYGGTEGLRGSRENDGILKTIKKSTNNFDTVTHIGIFRDMDYTGNPLHSIQASLILNGMPEVTTLGQIEEKDGLKVGVYLFPNNHGKGMLEDLCLSAFAEDKIIDCIDDYLSCLNKKDLELVESSMPKAKLHILFASKSVDKSIRSKDREVWKLDTAVQKRWWNWQHSAFEPIKNFLRQLAE